MSQQHSQAAIDIKFDKKLPAVSIGWDAEKQGIQFAFNTGEFKTWNFIIALLEMAKLKAESEQRFQDTAQRQAQLLAMAQQQQHDAAIMNQVMRGNGNPPRRVLEG